MGRKNKKGGDKPKFIKIDKKKLNTKKIIKKGPSIDDGPCNRIISEDR